MSTHVTFKLQATCPLSVFQTSPVAPRIPRVQPPVDLRQELKILAASEDLQRTIISIMTKVPVDKWPEQDARLLKNPAYISMLRYVLGMIIGSRTAALKLVPSDAMELIFDANTTPTLYHTPLFTAHVASLKSAGKIDTSSVMNLGLSLLTSFPALLAAFKEDCEDAVANPPDYAQLIAAFEQKAKNK